MGDVVQFPRPEPSDFGRLLIEQCQAVESFRQLARVAPQVAVRLFDELHAQACVELDQ